jgi:hypothetical protein
LTPCSVISENSVTNYFTVVGVDSLAPEGNPAPVNTNLPATYVYCASGNRVRVVATSCPALAASELPSCWSMTPNNGNNKLEAYVGLTNAGRFEVVARAGTSAKTNIFIVEKASLSLATTNIFVNSDDDNANGTNDAAEALSGSGAVVVGENDLIPLSLNLSGVPSNQIVTLQLLSQWVSSSGQIRVWSSASRGPGEPILDNTLSRSGNVLGNKFSTNWLASQMPATLWIEGVVTSRERGDVSLTLSIDGLGCPSKVELTVFDLQIAADANHDQAIDFGYPDLTSTNKPMRFWMNDDMDADDTVYDVPPEDGIPGDSDVPRGGGGNGSDGIVDGRIDFIDFFPVALDLKNTINLFGLGNGYEYKLSGSGVNFVYTTDQNPFAYLTQLAATDASHYGPDLNEPLTYAQIIRLDGTVTLSSTFLQSIINNSGPGYILVEGREPTTQPLRLQLWKNGQLLGERQLFLKITGVEQMFRHLNLHAHAGGTIDVSSRATAPNWPDQLTNGKNLLFAHGYNVNQYQARGWAAEMFKRTWQSGSNAKFHAISWRGDETQIFGSLTVNLQTNIVHAMQTAPALASYLNGLVDENVIIAHSLGNMLASAVVNLNDATVSKFFMVDGAVAMEAFDPSADQEAGMVNSNWVDYFFGSPDFDYLFASEWHKLFSATDPRSKLTWRALFTNWRNTEVFNYYSTGEEVLANIPYDKGNNLLDAFDAARFPWGCQEKLKGRMPVEVLGSTVAGWGFNEIEYGHTTTSTDPISGVVRYTWVKPTSTEAHTIQRSQLPTHPFFSKTPGTLFSSDEAAAKTFADQNRFDLLSRAIPARTFAVGANSLGGFADQKDLQALQTLQTGWPSVRTDINDYRWKHSDCRNVAYIFTYKMFEAIINSGGLK